MSLEPMQRYPVRVLPQWHGRCVDITVEDVPYYGQWIQGEGADICLLRSQGDGRLIGITLPLYKWNGNIVGLDLRNSRTACLRFSLECLAQLGKFTIIDAMLREADLENEEDMMIMLASTQVIKTQLPFRQKLHDAAKARNYPVEGLE